MTKITYVTDAGGDWEGLYIDGRIADGVEQNHSLSLFDILDVLAKKFGAEFEHYECAEQWMHDAGHFPDDLDDIPDDAKVNF